MSSKIYYTGIKEERQDSLLSQIDQPGASATGNNVVTNDRPIIYAFIDTQNPVCGGFRRIR